MSVSHLQEQLDRIINQANHYIDDLNRFNQSNEAIIEAVIKTLSGSYIGIDRQVAQTLEEVNTELFLSVMAMQHTIERAEAYKFSL